MTTAREKGVLAVMDATVGRLRDGVTRGDEILKSAEYSAADKAATRDVQARISADLQDNIEARATVAELIEALRGMRDLYDRMMKEANHANSCYQAETFAAMNNAPIRADAALASANGESP